MWPHKVKRLALIAPWGIYDERRPADGRVGAAPRRPAAACSSPIRGLEGLQGCAAGRQFGRMADRAGTRLGSGCASVLAARQHAAREAVADDHRADAAALGRAGSCDAAELCRRDRNGDQGSDEIKTMAGAGHLAELDQPDATAKAILEFHEYETIGWVSWPEGFRSWSRLRRPRVTQHFTHRLAMLGYAWNCCWRQPPLSRPR